MNTKPFHALRKRGPACLVFLMLVLVVSAPVRSAGPAPPPATLLDAARFGDVEAVRRSLSRGAPLDARGSQGRTALWTAADADLAEIVHNSYDPSPAQLQSRAAAYLQIVRLLLARGADPNIADDDGITPLDVAAFRGRTAIVTALLQAHADPNRRDGYGKTPLEWTAYLGHAEIAALLRGHGARVNPRRGLPGVGQRHLDGALLAALSFPHFDSDANMAVVKGLLDRGADPNAYLLPAWEVDTPPEMQDLMSPSPRDDPKTFTLFLTRGAGVDVHGPHPYTILLGPDPACTRLLLDYDARRHGGHPSQMPDRLLYAAQNRRAEESLGQMRALLAADPSVRVPPTAPLETHSEPALALLIAHGGNVNARDGRGRTRLMALADERYGEGGVAACDDAWAAVLLRHGADPNVADRHGVTALMLLCAQGEYGRFNSGRPVAFARELLAHGARPDARDNVGRSALQIAQRSGARSLARLLREPK